MNELLKSVLGGRTVDQALREEARAIKAIGASHQEKTYAAKTEYGYTTAKILPVPKEKAA